MTPQEQKASIAYPYLAKMNGSQRIIINAERDGFVKGYTTAQAAHEQEMLDLLEYASSNDCITLHMSIQDLLTEFKNRVK